MCDRYRYALGRYDIHEDFSQTRLPLRFPALAA
jgi:hypothetical protein